MSVYIADKVKMLNENLEKGLRNKDSDALEEAKVPLRQLQDHIRESIQASMRESATELIKKLKRGKDLTGEDLRILEKWVVGDAEYYTEIENNFKEWVNECERLNNLLASYNSPDFKENESELFKLNAFLTDLEFTLSDVIRYIESSNRVKRFRDQATSGRIDDEDKKWLADLIGRQLYSEEF